MQPERPQDSSGCSATCSATPCWRKIVMGSVANDNSLGWNATFWMFIVASLLATAFCATTWKREKQALSR